MYQDMFEIDFGITELIGKFVELCARIPPLGL